MDPLIWLLFKFLRMWSAKGGERGERTTRVKRANENAAHRGREQAAERRSARTRSGEEERETHNLFSSVIWPTSIGIVPRIFRLYKSLRVCAAWKEGRDMWEHRVGGEERVQVTRRRPQAKERAAALRRNRRELTVC